MGNTTSSELFRSASEISTGVRCDNCGILLNKVIWMRCKLCKAFDLCNECEKIPYDQLPRATLANHRKVHPNTPLTQDCLEPVSITQANEDEAEEGDEARRKTKEREYQRIIRKNKIRNDYDLDLIMTHLRNQPPVINDPLTSLVLNYQLQGHQRNIRVLSLDGGGVRGYLTIKVLSELIIHEYLPHVHDPDLKDEKFQEQFFPAQKKFTQQFDYIIGTSTGGLIAFCLAIDYNILKIAKIYSDAKTYFKGNWTGPWVNSKYDPSPIHEVIDSIIDQIPSPRDKQNTLSSKHATLFDIRNVLNPLDPINDEDVESEMRRRGNTSEFVDDDSVQDTPDIDKNENSLNPLKREKVLLITSYNTSRNLITIFNTSYAKHWGYPIADVLKSTMAAPTYFPPQKVFPRILKDGRFDEEGEPEVYIDGGVFANDPAVAALWAIRMQWRKPVNYHLLCLGTGGYTASATPSARGGYVGWIFNNGFLINTLMEATASFNEVLSSNLAKFRNVRRMKLNYTTKEAMSLDDVKFPGLFDKEWERLKNEDDFKALIYFYRQYIVDETHSENI